MSLVAGAGGAGARPAARRRGAGRGAARGRSPASRWSTPPLVYLMVKLVYNGLLTLAIRFTDAAPVGRLFSGCWLGLAILAGAALLALPALVAAISALRADPAAAPVAAPHRAGRAGGAAGDRRRAARGDRLPAGARRAAGAGAPGRDGTAPRLPPQAREPPASFWTAVATGVPGPDHGVTSLDSFRPLGVRTPLARSGPLRAWWSRVEVPLGLAEYRPVLANRRRAFTVWELASRGGEPSLAVNWWATFPAEAIPGLVVAHGAYQLLREGAEARWRLAPKRPAVAALAARSGQEPRRTRRLAAALPAAGGGARCSTAPCCPDRFYREVFARRMTPRTAGSRRGPRRSTCRGSTSRPTAGGAATWPWPTWCAASCGGRPAARRRPRRAPGRWRWCSIPAGGATGERGG